MHERTQRKTIMQSGQPYLLSPVICKH